MCWIVSFIQHSPGSSLQAQITWSDCTRDNTLSPPFHPDKRVPQVAVKRGILRKIILRSWSLNRCQRDTTLEQRLTSGELTKNFLSPRFSLEGLLSNMPYPDGCRFTCFLRRTWLDNNIFKPLACFHEYLPRTKVLLPNMWQVLNEKTHRIVLWVMIVRIDFQTCKFL